MTQISKPAHVQFQELTDRAIKEGWGFHEQIVKAAGLMCRLGVDPEVASEMMEKAGGDVTRRSMEPGEVRRVVNWIYQGDHDYRPYDKPKTSVKVEQTLIDELSQGGSIKKMMAASEPIPPTTKIFSSNFTMSLPYSIYPLTTASQRMLRRGSNGPMAILKIANSSSPQISGVG